MAVNFAERCGQRLARQFLQLRLGIEQIDMARAAFHEQPDDGLGFRRVVRLLRSHADRHGAGRAQSILVAACCASAMPASPLPARVKKLRAAIDLPSDGKAYRASRLL